MIFSIILLVWYISQAITFLGITYKFCYWIFSGQREKTLAFLDETKVSRRGFVDVYRTEKRLLITVALGLGGILFSVAGILGWPVLAVASMARNRANNEKKQAAAQRESLKLLARSEPDEKARVALEAGDTTAYIDRLLDLNLADDQISASFYSSW